MQLSSTFFEIIISAVSKNTKILNFVISVKTVIFNLIAAAVLYAHLFTTEVCFPFSVQLPCVFNNFNWFLGSCSGSSHQNLDQILTRFEFLSLMLAIISTKIKQKSDDSWRLKAFHILTSPAIST